MKSFLATPMKKSHVILLVSLFTVAGLLIGARTALNNAVLVTDMDAAGHKINNMAPDQPLPAGGIPDGAITNAKVSDTAGIVQSKLNLNGPMPGVWLGTSGTTAARGDLAERLENKGQPNGYANLDSGGKLPTSLFPALAGTGTVTNVSVATANGVSGTVATSTTTPAISLSLAAITPTKVSITGTASTGYISFADQSFAPLSESNLHIFSIASGYLGISSAVFNNHNLFIGAVGLTTDRVINFQDKSGNVAFLGDLPTAVQGVGINHKEGLVIDPGPTGNSTDYLARDATWKSATTFSAPSYQPVCPTPQFFPTANTTGPRTVTMGANGLAGASMFYEVGASSGPFLPYTGSSVTVNAGVTIYGYSSKTGYTNSSLGSYTNPNP